MKRVIVENDIASVLNKVCIKLNKKRSQTESKLLAKNCIKLNKKRNQTESKLLAKNI